MHEQRVVAALNGGILSYGPVWENNGRTVSQSCFMGCNCGLARGGPASPMFKLGLAWPGLASARVRSTRASATTSKADRSVTVLTFATKHETSFRLLGARLRLRAGDLCPLVTVLAVDFANCSPPRLGRTALRGSTLQIFSTRARASFVRTPIMGISRGEVELNRILSRPTYALLKRVS